MAGAACLADHPGSTSPGRLVSHVLVVPAVEFGDPVLLAILMVIDDAP